MSNDWDPNDQGAVARRHMSVETMASITENANIKLPAVAD